MSSQSLLQDLCCLDPLTSWVYNNHNSPRVLTHLHATLSFNPVSPTSFKPTSLVPVTKQHKMLPPNKSVSYRDKVLVKLYQKTYLSVSTGPLSSMGSPMTLMILPRVIGPTGILIGVPVSLQAWPRIKPSVPSIAMVRTVFSPVAEQYQNIALWHKKTQKANQAK